VRKSRNRPIARRRWQCTALIAPSRAGGKRLIPSINCTETILPLLMLRQRATTPRASAQLRELLRGAVSEVAATIFMNREEKVVARGVASYRYATATPRGMRQVLMPAGRRAGEVLSPGGRTPQGGGVVTVLRDLKKRGKNATFAATERHTYGTNKLEKSGGAGGGVINF